MIRTLVEIHEDRVIVTLDSAQSAQPSELDWAAVRAERDRLRDRSVSLAAELEKAELGRRTNRVWAERVEQNNARLSAALVKAEQSLSESRDLVAFQGRNLEDSEKDKDKLFSKIRRAREILTGPAVTNSLMTVGGATMTAILKAGVRDAIAALDQ
jgi:hypothetical protein